MAVPKKRTSLTRRRLRRTHHKIASLSRGSCSNCKSMTVNHNVCHVCGYYKGRQYIKIVSERA